MADAMVALMWRYPQVWVDTSVIAWALPRAELEAYLARLLRAGFGERILFASGASTARRMAEAAEAIRSSDVLPPAVKRAILGGNAARLLARVTP